MLPSSSFLFLSPFTISAWASWDLTPSSCPSQIFCLSSKLIPSQPTIPPPQITDISRIVSITECPRSYSHGGTPPKTMSTC